MTLQCIRNILYSYQKSILKHNVYSLNYSLIWQQNFHISPCSVIEMYNGKLWTWTCAFHSRRLEGCIIILIFLVALVPASYRSSSSSFSVAHLLSSSHSSSHLTSSCIEFQTKSDWRPFYASHIFRWFHFLSGIILLFYCHITIKRITKFESGNLL